MDKWEAVAIVGVAICIAAIIIVSKPAEAGVFK